MNNTNKKFFSYPQFLIEWFLNKLFYRAVDYGFLRLSAVFLSLLTNKVNHTKAGKKILCIGSLASLDDINAIIVKSNVHQYLYLPRFYFGYVLRKYVDIAEINADNYHINSTCREGRGKVYADINKIFPVLKKVLGFDAVMSSNFGYIEQQEFVAVARKHGIPVIILYKEGLGNKRILTSIIAKSYTNRKAQCDLFLCYNESIKKALLKYGVKGLEKNNIVVTGPPRMDLYVDAENSDNNKQITLFSFIAEDKFSYIVDDTDTLRMIKEKNVSFHEAVIRFAIENPEYKVVIKTKKSKRDISYVTDIAGNYMGSGALPANLFITNTGDAMNYIIQSHRVLGANSTVLIEALLARKRVISLDFSVFFDDSSWNLFEGYEQLLKYISSYDDLVKVVKFDTSVHEREEKGLNLLLQQYIYSADGAASVRVESAISDLLS
ncbi:MAG TPA: hypothetical protein EYP35_01160 [Desulfobacterales bacterium]|nr:hypothetical protein [Desulfobacterales bacterium]HIP38364.1 hypothetical protein [Desulfocapsa sulfexigens]